MPQTENSGEQQQKLFPQDPSDYDLRRQLRAQESRSPIKKTLLPGEPGFVWTESVRSRKTGRYRLRRGR